MATPQTVSRLQSLVIEGPAGPLEALLQEHEGREAPNTGLVCHPHPLYGGTLHNKVVHRTASVLHQLGAAVLRFNFRGVGTSAGRFDHGAGELEDARAAHAFLIRRHPRARRWVAGFSFGSWVAARLAASEPDTERLILVAPPVGTQDFSVMRTMRTPTLVVQGTADTTCRPELLDRAVRDWSPPLDVRKIEGATHFFDRQLADLAQALVEALSGPASGATS